jgi:hypothetical protein
MTQHKYSPKAPQPHSYSPHVPIPPDRRRSDHLCDGAFDCATCLVVALVAAAFVASVTILSCTAMSLAFDEPVAVASVAYENRIMPDMLGASHLRGGLDATPCFYKLSV